MGGSVLARAARRDCMCRTWHIGRKGRKEASGDERAGEGLNYRWRKLSTWPAPFRSLLPLRDPGGRRAATAATASIVNVYISRRLKWRRKRKPGGLSINTTSVLLLPAVDDVRIQNQNAGDDSPEFEVINTYACSQECSQEWKRHGGRAGGR